MQEIYSTETINAFTKESGYTSKFIEMDKLLPDDNGDKPAYYWYKKQFHHPNGGKIEIRVGMDGTGLSDEQKEILTKMYDFIDMVRAEYPELVYHSEYPSQNLILRLRNQISAILKNNLPTEEHVANELSWILLFLEIAQDITKNSPLPFTIIDDKDVIKTISPAYAAMVGYTINDILKPGFLGKIYPGIEGDVLNESMKFYKEHGYFLEGVSLTVIRGEDFR